MGEYTGAVSGQRLGKHIPVATQQILNAATVKCMNRKAVFSVWYMPRCYKQGARSDQVQFCTGGCELEARVLS
jgi:hypothetical protein